MMSDERPLRKGELYWMDQLIRLMVRDPVVTDLMNKEYLIRADDAEGLRAALGRLEGEGPMGKVATCLSDEVMARLREHAQALGLDVGDHIGRLLTKASALDLPLTPSDGAATEKALPNGWAGPDEEGDYYHRASGRFMFPDPHLGWFMLLGRGRVDVCPFETSAAQACALASKILEGGAE